MTAISAAEDVHIEKSNVPSDFKTLKNEITVAESNSQLDLDKDYKFNKASDSKYKMGIEINQDNLIIDGHGHTIDADGQAKIFNVNGKGITIKNLNFINAISEGYGSVLTVDESAIKVCIDNCTFENNKGHVGGAIAWFGDYGELKNSNFNNNSAYLASAGYFTCPTKIIGCNFTNNYGETVGTIFYGGTVDLEKNMIHPYGGDSFGIITGCIFDHNNAGGAACGEFYAECIIKDSKFTNNHAIKVGAFTLMSLAGVIRVYGCDIINNTAEDICGGIASHSNGEINNCNFINNTAQRGAALYASKIKYVTNCNFTGNHAKNDGIMYGVIISNIEGCNFNNNTVDESTGTISLAPFAPGFKLTTEMSNCNFNNNTSPDGIEVTCTCVNLVADNNSFDNKQDLERISLKEGSEIMN